MKTVFPKNAKNARKSQNTPSTNPYQNETQFSPLSLKSGVSRHPRQPKSVICPPVISGTNSRASSLKLAKFRHGTAGLSNVGVSPTGGRGKPFRLSFPKRTHPESCVVCNYRQSLFSSLRVACLREVKEKLAIGSEPFRHVDVLGAVLGLLRVCLNQEFVSV